MSVNKKNVRVYLANILGSLGDTDGKIAGYILQQPGMGAPRNIRYETNPHP